MVVIPSMDHNPFLDCRDSLPFITTSEMVPGGQHTFLYGWQHKRCVACFVHADPRPAAVQTVPQYQAALLHRITIDTLCVQNCLLFLVCEAVCVTLCDAV